MNLQPTTNNERSKMRTLTKLTLSTLLAAGLFAGSATATTLSSKAALTQGVQARPVTAVVADKPLDTAAISTKADKAPGTAQQVAVPRTQHCSKPMDMASNTCKMHCR